MNENLPSTLSSLLPIRSTLKSGFPILITSVTPSSPITRLNSIFNEIIEDGNTYPQEFPLNADEFRNLFLSHDAFVALKDISNEDVWRDEHVLGMFYVKPNYPGRCSHICNAGFVVPRKYRNDGVGKAMARAFVKIAPALGYKASVFNLVFETNIGSIKIWRDLGFKEIGRIPKAARLRGHEKLVDALMFYYDFEQSQ
ncbi:7623_t:CDS:2 [Paraglomus occultum]|uniref:7623_t:CDS:1 n=1 Tax=Paraglomus occultum TaxID=144539 RepID=A0A9N9GCY4_9GLOM|nr:7623_t:CDS:2 [Paraglomus occultum]